MPTTDTIQQWLGEQIVPLFLIGFAILMGLAMVYLSALNRMLRCGQRTKDAGGV